MPSDQKVYFVNLEFPLRNGTVKWATHVTASDEEGAVETAIEWFWEHLNFAGVKPSPRVKEVYEDLPGAATLNVERHVE